MVAVGQRMKQARAAPLRAHKLNAAEGRQRLDRAREQLEFVPDELVVRCRQLIKQYHSRPASGAPADALWNSDSRRLVEDDPALRILFRHACNTRDAKLARERQEGVTALILAVEVLVKEFGRWSAQFPEAKHNAERLFANVSRKRGWLIDLYGYPTLRD